MKNVRVKIEEKVLKQKKLTIETGLYAAAFLVGALIRFYRLGSLPLGDSEASLALQALSLANGDLPPLGSLASYLGITKLFFSLFEASPFLARLWPALIGSLLILTPALFRDLLGKGPATILSFGLALDGLLIAASRQVSGEILAVTFFLAGIGFFYNKAYAWSGISLAMALMSGPAFPQGIIIVLLIILVNRLLIKDNLFQIDSSAPPTGLTEVQKKRLVYWTLGTFLFFGTQFFTLPQVIGGSFQNIPEYLRGWSVSSGVNAGLLLVAVLSYELFPLIFGLIGTVWPFQRSDRTQKILNLWLFFALLLFVVYPGRQILGLVWLVIPLWALASRSLFGIFSSIEKNSQIVSVLLAGLVLVLLIFAVLNLSALTNEAPDNFTTGLSGDQVKWIRIVGALVVSALVVTLVAWGWSVDSAMKGLCFALAVFTFVFTLSSSWNAAGLGRHPEAELSRVDGGILEADLFLKTIEDHVEWNKYSQPDLQIVVVDVPSPSVKWAMRHLPRVQDSAFLPGDSEPGIIVTQDEETLMLASSYSGQNFIWGQQTNWSLILPREWLSWLFFREAPKESEVLVVWVRSDLFPGAEETN